MRTGAGAALAAAALVAGCGLLPGAVRPVPTGARMEPRPDGSAPDRAYYADLGPAEIDVSGYPEEQRRNYEVFVRACGRCHTLARAVNSPTQSRLYWRFHLARMGLHSRLGREGPIPKADRKAVLDFLEHDSRVRKIEDKAAFEKRTEELKRRFDPILQQYLWDLYQGRGRRPSPDDEFD